MSRPTDIRPVEAKLWLLPVTTRVPLKFGTETLTSVLCARVCLTVERRDGSRVSGWGETPLSVQWVWPSSIPYQARLDALVGLTKRLVGEWANFREWGHPMEIGRRFMKSRLSKAARAARDCVHERIPHLAALVCCSAFDIALHDAFGHAVGLPTYDTYSSEFMTSDLYMLLDRDWLVQELDGVYPDAIFADPPDITMPAWHLVGGKDPLTPDDLVGDEPDDGYPVLLRDWIERDGLYCLKVKLRGDDVDWDYDRIRRVGQIANEMSVLHLCTDFNCTVRDPAYVHEVLDRVERNDPTTYERLLYVEQPFPYDLEKNAINVASIAERKLLFMDESAHDWRMVGMGFALGWNGVALKTCKTQTGAILSLCIARRFGMEIMVQDLTNPMLAQIPHVQLAAHAGTIMGVETNAMQFYPDASLPEAAVHPGLYRRTNGKVDLRSISGPGFGYRLDEIERKLYEPAAQSG